MRGLLFVGIALALAGLGVLAVVQERADDNEAVEARVRAEFARLGEDVAVSCRRSGSRWRCDYANGPFRGSLVTDESAHVEISIIH
jgi:hypothetical protein